MLVAGHLLLFFALVAASVHDIRTREVPDWLSYSLIAVGLFHGLILGIIQSWYYLVWSILGFTVAFGFSSLLYYTGQWGGGDAKLLMGIGALYGLAWPFSGIPNLALFVMFLFVGGALYGMIWSLVLSITHWNQIKHNLTPQRGHIKILLLLCTGVILLLLLLPIRGFHLSIIVLLFGIMYLLLMVLKSVEKTCFIKNVRPSELTEGDWITQKITIKGKTVFTPKDTGLTKKQLATLQHLGKKNKHFKVTVKYGIPFVPSFLFAYLALLLWQTM